MDAEEDAWAEQRVRESGFIDKAIELAKALADGAAQIELDIETGIPIHSHEIPMEVPGLVGSFNMRNTTFVAHVDGQDVTDVSGEIDEMYEHEGEESTEKSGGESMYKQNNITNIHICPLLPHRRDVLPGMRSPKDLGHLRTALAHAAALDNQGLPCKTTNWMVVELPLASWHAERCPRSLHSVLVQVLVLRPEGG